MNHLPKLLPILLLLLCTNLSGQTVLLGEDLRGDTVVPDYGMNRKHFRHFYIGFQFAGGAPETPGASISHGSSWAMEYGLRYKRRFSQVFSAGYEASISRMAFVIRQGDDKEIPDLVQRDREKLVFLQTGLGLYKRANYGKRGDYIGRFIDVGIFGQWHFNVRHVGFKETDNERIRIRRSSMDYPRNFSYGILGRKGFNNFVFKTTYRVSDLFRSSADLPELPRFMFGMQIGIHPL